MPDTIFLEKILVFWYSRLIVFGIYAMLLFCVSSIPIPVSISIPIIKATNLTKYELLVRFLLYSYFNSNILI